MESYAYNVLNTAAVHCDGMILHIDILLQWKHDFPAHAGTLLHHCRSPDCLRILPICTLHLLIHIDTASHWNLITRDSFAHRGSSLYGCSTETPSGSLHWRSSSECDEQEHSEESLSDEANSRHRLRLLHGTTKNFVAIQCRASK